MKDNELCQQIRNLLTGQAECEHLSDLEFYRQHWTECESCQSSAPDAYRELENMEEELLASYKDDVYSIKKNIERLHAKYCFEVLEKEKIIKEELDRSSAEWAKSHPPNITIGLEGFASLVRQASDSQLLHAQMLILLADKGKQLQEQLESINENWGLDKFHVVSENDSSEYSSPVCAPLIASLPEPVQIFVFRAILVADMWQFAEDLPDYSSTVLYRTVERAVPELLRLYFEEHQLQGNDIRTLANRDDLGDSIKAGQMEILRQIASLQYGKTTGSAEISEYLANLLGKEIFRRLHFDTLLFLNRAETHFRASAQTGDWFPAIHYFHRAYENQFRNSLTRPLVKSLVNKGHKNYGMKNKPLIVSTNFAGLGLGDQLSYLQDDTYVRTTLSNMSFDVEEILREATMVNKTRNRATHGDGNSYAAATRLRDMVLGIPSIFKTLLPSFDYRQRP